MEYKRIMTNPSTIWAMLALPNPPVGSIPFVASDSTTIVTDVVNFFYSQAGLSIYAGSTAPLQLTVAGGLRLSYSDLSANPSTAVTINKPAGRAAIPIGSNNITITCSYCFSTSIVHLQFEGNAYDATAGFGLHVVPSNGSFRVNTQGNATLPVAFSFVIYNVF